MPAIGSESRILRRIYAARWTLIRGGPGADTVVATYYIVTYLHHIHSYTFIFPFFLFLSRILILSLFHSCCLMADALQRTAVNVHRGSCIMAGSDA